MRRGTTAELRGWHQRFADRPLGVGQIGRVGAAGHHPTSEKPLCCEYPQTIPPSQTPSQTLLCEQRLRGCWSKKGLPKRRISARPTNREQERPVLQGADSMTNITLDGDERAAP